MSEQLTQSNFEDLSAWFDGSGDEDRTGRIEKLVCTDDAWRRAHEDLIALDKAMDHLDAPPVPQDLVERIVRAARRGRNRRKLTTGILRLGVGLGASAAVLALAIGLFSILGPKATSPDTGPRAQVDKTLLIVTQLDALTGGLGLTETLKADANGESWDRLTPVEQTRRQEQFLAFLQMDAQEQKAHLARYKTFTRLTPAQRETYRARAKWLQAVVESFSPDRRKDLLAMPAGQREREILDRKTKLTAEGKLTSD